MGKFYRVVEGVHYDGRMNKYNKGDIVESSEDLTEKFPLKFVEAPGEKRASSPSGQLDTPKAQRMSQSTKSDAAGDSSPKEQEEASEQEPEKKEREKDPRGMDATSNFPEAAKAGLSVFRRGKYFFVFDNEEVPEDLEKAEPLNDTGLTSEDVIGFLKKEQFIAS